ncbi:autotransporter domain-containing protein [Achromobacter sp. F4_2707]|uniref:autotransporter domain-containing protein n=1 Tax=Achromobacter sp. F4_2707 TaxID=3114286 RepID=UPI0039C75D4C
MKKLAAWSLWLDGCVFGAASLAGAAQAALPPDTVITSAEEAREFSNSTPFVFSGQTLSVQSSFSTDRDFQLERRAQVVVGSGVHFEIRGKVSSTGAPLGAPLEKRGLGTLHLSGDNSYTSNTVLREGVLQLSGDAAVGHASYSLEQHGGTVLHLEPGTQLWNILQVSKTRPGDTPLPGLEGEAQWRVDEGVATLVHNVNALMPVRKTGHGTLRLGSVAQGHFPLFVEAGALAVDDMAAAHVEVGAGARLEGYGELASAYIRTGGMLAPGGRDQPGVLSVWEGAVFEPGSTYHVNAYPDGRADLLNISGVAALAGRVWAEAGTGSWAQENRYRILAADGGLNHTTFAGVDTNLAFLQPSLEYDDHNVYLLLSHNGTGPGDVAETPEDKEVGDAIAPPGGSRPATPLEDAIRGMSVEQVRALLRQSSGGWHASVRSFVMEEGRYLRQAVLASGRSALDTRPETGSVQAQASAQALNTVARAHAGTGVRAWAQPYSAFGRRQPIQRVMADRHSSHGLILGLDAPASQHWRLGLTVGAQRSDLVQRGRWASAQVDSLSSGLTAYGNWDGMRVTAALLRTWHRIDSRRRVSAGPLQELLRSAYLGRSWQAVVEFLPHLRSANEWRQWLRSRLDSTVQRVRPGVQPAGGLTDHWRMGPYLRHEWARLDVPQHGETGGLSAHAVAASTTSMHATTLGVRARRDGFAAGQPVWLEADGGWRQLWGSGRVNSRQHFSAGEASGYRPVVFRSAGQPLVRNAFALGLEGGWAPQRNARLALRYAGLYGGGYRDHAAWADLRWVF